MNVNDFKKLSRIDRLQAMELLWESMLYENEDIETPEWHDEILKERKKIIESGKAEFISLSDLKASRRQ
jgi:hypothetical protein